MKISNAGQDSLYLYILLKQTYQKIPANHPYCPQTDERRIENKTEKEKKELEERWNNNHHSPTINK